MTIKNNPIKRRRDFHVLFWDTINLLSNGNAFSSFFGKRCVEPLNVVQRIVDSRMLLVVTGHWKLGEAPGVFKQNFFEKPERGYRKQWVDHDIMYINYRLSLQKI